MPFFRFSRHMCMFVFPPFFLRPLCFEFVVILWLFFLNFLHVFCVTKMTSDLVYARAQAAILRSSGHSVKENAKLFNKTERWVNKWSKRECFDDKPRSGRPSVLINCPRNSIEKANNMPSNLKEKDCQESSAEKYRSLEHNGVDTWPGKDGRLSSERKYFCWARSKGKPVWDSPKIREADSRRLEHFFLFTYECPKYIF